MKIYRNLFAGNPTWFIETHKTGNMRKGFGFALCKDGIYFERQASYYNSSFTESPDKYPMVGEVTAKEMFDFIMAKCNERKAK